MIVQLTKNGLRIDRITVEKIKDDFSKINKYLPNLPDDLQLNIFIKKVASIAHPKNKHHLKNNYVKTKMAVTRFEGWVKLVLPKKVLYSEFAGLTVNSGLFKGKRDLTREIKKYKELHFKSQSQYPNRDSIRKAEEK